MNALRTHTYAGIPIETESVKFQSLDELLTLVDAFASHTPIEAHASRFLPVIHRDAIALKLLAGDVYGLTRASFSYLCKMIQVSPAVLEKLRPSLVLEILQTLVPNCDQHFSCLAIDDCIYDIITLGGSVPQRADVVDSMVDAFAEEVDLVCTGDMSEQGFDAILRRDSTTVSNPVLRVQYRSMSTYALQLWDESPCPFGCNSLIRPLYKSSKKRSTRQNLQSFEAALKKPLQLLATL